MKDFKGWGFVISSLVGVGLALLAVFLFRSNRNSENFSETGDAEVTQTRLASEKKDGEVAQEESAKVANQQNAQSGIPTTLRELELKYNATLKLTTTPNGFAFRLSGIVKNPNRNPSSVQGDTNFAMDYIKSAAGVLGIDNVNQLQPDGEPQKDPLGKTLYVGQYYTDANNETVQVYGGMVRAHMDGEGSIIMVNNSFVPSVSGINNTPTITQDVALAVALADAKKYDPQNKGTPKPGESKLYIYKFLKHGEKIDLAWRIVVNQHYLGAKHAVGEYFVNAHNEAMFERNERAIE